jgi:putative ABC transport system permease protein
LDWPGRIRAALAAHQHTPDADVVEELAQHAAATDEAARADGCDVAEATRRVDALIAAWCADASRLRRRPARQPMPPPPPADGAAWAGLMQDVKYGMRLLRRQPGFTFVAILTMALGIGATTTLFSITYGVLLKPLPWPDADRLVRLSESRLGHEPRVHGTITNGTYISWHAQPSTIEELGGWITAATTLSTGGGDSVRLRTAAITPSLFTVLKARPWRGRLFVAADGRPGGSFAAADVILLSYGLWQEQFGGRDGAVGSVMQVGGKPLTVIGVMPPDFAFPDRETRAWTPFAVASVLGDQGAHRISIFSALARLRPGVTPAQAAAEGSSRARSAPDPGLAAVAMFGGNGPAEIAAVPAIDMMTAEVRPALLVLLAAVTLLLVTATANVASLQLARATTRRREIAIRAAIGAGVGRLTRQLVVESAIVGAAGGVVGVALALALHRALPSLLPADFPRLTDVAIDARVMLFAVLVSMVASVACGLLPSLFARRLNVTESLADGGSAPVGGGMRSPTVRARTIIMVGQVAIACLLLIGASLLTRSFVALLNVDRGYNPRNLLTARLPMPAAFSITRRTAVLDALTERLRPMPGVSNVAFGNALPLLSTGGFRSFTMRPPSDPSIEIAVSAMQRVVSPGYFQALGLRLIAGRELSGADTMTSALAIVVNKSFAAKYLGSNPVGAIVPNLGMCRGDNDRWEVVGVVEDMRQGGFPVDDTATHAEIFMPYGQVGCAAAVPDPILVVRTNDDPAPHTAALRTLLRDVEPTLAFDSVMTMEDRVMTTLAKPRLYAVVLVGFGAFALLIAGVGMFGVLSYSVAQRSREIGVRTALGATPASIVALIVRQVAAIWATGIAVGLWLAFAASQSLTEVLYGVNPHDRISFTLVPALLAIVTAIACIVPARRAARVDPLTALRA